ncbi:MAG: lamin tail domain-containing protein [Chloroflexi bacterium]|nr:lamin tail domain-containing protein [Chloroflexota bacterium]
MARLAAFLILTLCLAGFILKPVGKNSTLLQATVSATATPADQLYLPVALRAQVWRPAPTPTPTPTPQLFLPLALRSVEWRPAPTATPLPGLPLIRIITIVSTGRDEYITLTNRGASPQSLTGWKIISAVGLQIFQFPSDFTLEPAQNVRVHSGPDALNNPPADLL